MNIGEASLASGISSKMIRYYESIGVMRAPARRANDYRSYGEHEVHEIRFIGHARALGFSLEEIANLLSLWRDRDRTSKQVKAIAEEKLVTLERKITELQIMTATLRSLVDACHGDSRPDCPILSNFSENTCATAIPKIAPGVQNSSRRVAVQAK